MRAAVASGDFGSSSEVVRTALREWGERRERAQAEIELIRKLWKEGIDSGPSELETIDDIIAEAHRRHVAGNG